MKCEICSKDNVLRYNNVGWLCSECIKNNKMECTERELKKYDYFSERTNDILFGYDMGFDAGQNFGRQQESEFTKQLLEVRENEQ